MGRNSPVRHRSRDFTPAEAGIEIVGYLGQHSVDAGMNDRRARFECEPFHGCNLTGVSTSLLIRFAQLSPTLAVVQFPPRSDVA
jgi:hypothetical protein